MLKQKPDINTCHSMCNNICTWATCCGYHMHCDHLQINVSLHHAFTKRNFNKDNGVTWGRMFFTKPCKLWSGRSMSVCLGYGDFTLHPPSASDESYSPGCNDKAACDHQCWHTTSILCTRNMIVSEQYARLDVHNCTEMTPQSTAGRVADQNYKLTQQPSTWGLHCCWRNSKGSQRNASLFFACC